jgi:hypothetical protein
MDLGNQRHKESTMPDSIIAEKDTGRRITKLGTDWPVRLYVERQVTGGRKRWVLIELCNGEVFFSEIYRTRREALAALAAF